jgi:DDE superfamily endonuclease
MGLHEGSQFSLYHHILSRARWSALDLSRHLLHLLMRTFVAAGGDLTCVIDEPLERRWGRHINLRGHDRDPLASSKQRSVATRGLRTAWYDKSHATFADVLAAVRRHL